MILDVLSEIFQKFIALLDTFFQYVFGGVRFSVLWSWLPSDIGDAASSLIVVLFGLALISFVRHFLPF